MRRWFAVLALTLSACAGGTSTVRYEDADPGAFVTAITIGIRAALSSLRNDLPALAGELKTFSCGSHKCYRVADVNTTLAAIRKRAAQAFPPEAVALRLAVDTKLREASALEWYDAPSPVQLIATKPVKAYDPDDVNQVFARIRAVLDQILSYEELAPTIQVFSTPDAALLDLRVSEDEFSHKTMRTNGPLENIWRGVYNGELQRPGYRKAKVTLDLIGGMGKRLTCTLVPDNASKTAESFCKLEK